METKILPNAKPGLTLPSPKTILVPVDFSDCSLAGIEAAKALAARWGCRVEVVHVDEGLPAGLAQGMDAPEDRQRVKDYYAELGSRLETTRAVAPSSCARLLEGSPAEVLSRIAKGAGFDLIVMGTHGRKGVTRLVLGSVAERVVHSSHVLVLTVHSKPEPGWPSRILVPMKYAKYADRALVCAVNWGAAFGAPVTVMHVAEESGREREEERALEEHLLDLLGQEAYDRLGRVAYRGRVEESILGETKVGRFDLVILAEHFRTHWRDLLLGTTAERILRLSTVPVLSVPSF